MVGTGKPSALKEKDFLKFGGAAAGKLNAGSDAVTVIAELPDGAMKRRSGGRGRLGRPAARLQIRSLQDQEEGRRGRPRCAPTFRSRSTMSPRRERPSRPNAHIVDGVIIARELVNEPPNVLYPEEFARRASQLRKLGVNVEVLDVKAMTKLGMGALLGVAQGSARPGRTVIMRWNGGKKGDAAGRFHRQGRLLRHRRHFDQAGAAAWRT